MGFPVRKEVIRAFWDARPAGREVRGVISPSRSTWRSLEDYTQEIRAWKVMTRAEETDVATRYVATRDRSLFEQLVCANLRWVVKVAKGYGSHRDHLADLIQQGNIGLMEAAERFDPTRGRKLSTFSFWWIKKEISSYITEKIGDVSIGRGQTENLLRVSVRKARAKLELLRGPDVSNADVAEELGVAEKHVDLVALRGRGYLSVESGGADGSPIGRLTAGVRSPEEIAEQNEEIALIRAAAYSLPLGVREKYILEHRLLTDDPETLDVAADRFGVSRQRINQIEDELKLDLALSLRRRHRSTRVPTLRRPLLVTLSAPNVPAKRTAVGRAPSPESAPPAPVRPPAWEPRVRKRVLL